MAGCAPPTARPRCECCCSAFYRTALSGSRAGCQRWKAQRPRDRALLSAEPAFKVVDAPRLAARRKIRPPAGAWLERENAREAFEELREEGLAPDKWDGHKWDGRQRGFRPHDTRVSCPAVSEALPAPMSAEAAPWCRG